MWWQFFSSLLSVFFTTDSHHGVPSHPTTSLLRHSRYRPIILIHGINNIPRDWDVFCNVVKTVRKGQEMHELASPFDGVPGSWLALSYQVSWFDREIRNLMMKEREAFRHGYDLVCHSQGAITCRALIQETDHRVVSFISLAGPQMGVFGDGWIDFFPPGLKNFTIGNAWELAYTDWSQATLSPANLWHDPYHETLFLQKDAFMRKILGLDGMTDPAGMARRKRNFLKLSHGAFLVGNFSSLGVTFDKGIDPWWSGIFGFYDTKGIIVPMFEQPMFTQDLFGLRTLHETGKLTLLAVEGVWHDDWIYDEKVIVKYVVPQLSPKLIKEGEV